MTSCTKMDDHPQQGPDAQVPRNKQAYQGHLLWPLTREAVKQGYQWEACWQHHSDDHHYPAHNGDKHDDPCTEIGRLQRVMVEEASIRGLAPKPQGEPGQGA
jgi:hypothetical protein